MKSKFLKGLVASFALAVSAFANAGLIKSEDAVEIPIGSVSYQEFTILFDEFVTLDAIIFGNDEDSDTINFFLFSGIFGSLGSIFDTNPPTTYQNDIDTISSTVFLTAGTYTYAIGTNFLTETEARTGFASTPGLAGVTYNYLISTVDVPEPSTLAVFALGLLGLGSRKFNKQA